MEKAPINRIIPFSNVDGPGNRTSIFVQKCPFRCLYCHNPETIHMCVNCGLCVPKCPAHALCMKDGRVVWNPDLCVSCDTCIHICPNLASPRIRWMSTADIMKELKPLLPYIEGITVSGGECTEYPAFFAELFRKVRKLGRTCLLDSNGFYEYSEMHDLMDAADGVMLDVKAYDPAWHQQLCGRDNQTVLSNLTWLQEHGKLEEVRTVCLPNEPERNAETVRAVSRMLDPDIRYKLICYRPFGVRQEGLKALGGTITSDQEIQRLVRLSHQCGHRNTVIV